jgi:hypothetical protein
MDQVVQEIIQPGKKYWIVMERGDLPISSSSGDKKERLAKTRPEYPQKSKATG